MKNPNLLPSVDDSTFFILLFSKLPILMDFKWFWRGFGEEVCQTFKKMVDLQKLHESYF
tara:strand:- start:11825 stop:12001 length:177 start_codon:yes stop_codon:yes gene_type:complete